MILASLLALTAATTTPIQPAGKWAVDYGDKKCTISRTFGSETAPTTFAIQPAGFDAKRLSLSVVVPIQSDKIAQNGKAVLTLQPSGTTASLDYTTWVTTDGKLRVYKIQAYPEQAAALADAADVSIAAGNQNIDLATGKLQAALGALTKCNDDLLRGMGADPAAMAVPVGNPGDWVAFGDYPTEALKRNAQGETTLVATVDGKGAVSACRITATAGDAELDRKSCEVVRQRGRFEPSSATAPRYWAMTIRWFTGS